MTSQKLCLPPMAGLLSIRTGNEVGCLCMLPIHHTAGTQTHKILLLFPWLGGSALPVNIFHVEFRKPMEPAYIHWRHLPDHAHLLAQAQVEHAGENSSDRVTPDEDHKSGVESEFMKITHRQWIWNTILQINSRKTSNSRKNPRVDWPKLAAFALYENQFTAAL